MSYYTFIGDLLIALGPALAIFFTFIIHSNQLIILTFGGAFFWSLSVVFASILFFIIPLQTVHWFNVIVAVLCQELFRFLFYKLYVKGESGFDSSSGILDRLSASVATGWGIGVASSCIMYVSILWESIGPANFFTGGCPNVSFFTVSAIISSIFVLLNILQTIIFFEELRKKSFIGVTFVVVTHLGSSLLTLANETVSCVLSILVLFVLLIVTAGYTYRIVNNSSLLQRKRR